MNKGFTLVEIIVVIAIIAVLSGIILFSTVQYINKGKDSNIAGNLAVLIPAGEVYYNIGTTYTGFCSSDVVKNSISQMPINKNGSCYSDTITSSSNPASVCCSVDTYGGAWAACARQFNNSGGYATGTAICVDSRGVKKEIDNARCSSSITTCAY